VEENCSSTLSRHFHQENRTHQYKFGVSAFFAADSGSEHIFPKARNSPSINCFHNSVGARPLADGLGLSANQLLEKVL
jgi:hypothetical protein